MAGNKEQPRVLCLRFSALGDAAIAAVVVKACAAGNPHAHFIFAGPPLTAPLFRGVRNVSFLPVDTTQSLRTLLSVLKKTNPDYIADLHNVLRSFLLRSVFFFQGLPVAFLRKGRRARRRMLARPAASAPLRPVYVRYADTLARLGFSVPSLERAPVISLKPRPWKKAGIAPFARHRGKQWDPERMRRIAFWLAEEGTQVLLFGGGEREAALLEEWTKDHGNISLAPGVVPSPAPAAELHQEQFKALAALDVMISMDSANMHFASALGIPVISVWGATHPKAGFYGYRQNPNRAVQLSLDCRPCSIYGAGKCHKGTYECLENLTDEQVWSYIKAYEEQTD
ncbi:MAG: glycosyltransferase family 9 protein [Bacteroidales bacterium]|jgi:ADP-heptose:LPS heptosyltransferase